MFGNSEESSPRTSVPRMGKLSVSGHSMLVFGGGANQICWHITRILAKDIVLPNVDHSYLWGFFEDMVTKHALSPWELTGNAVVLCYLWKSVFCAKKSFQPCLLEGFLFKIHWQFARITKNVGSLKGFWPIFLGFFVFFFGRTSYIVLPNMDRLDLLGFFKDTHTKHALKVD